MREKERFEEENISRESCQEPREPRGSPGSVPRGSLHNSKAFLKQSMLKNNCGGSRGGAGGGRHFLINQRLGLTLFAKTVEQLLN